MSKTIQIQGIPTEYRPRTTTGNDFQIYFDEKWLQKNNRHVLEAFKAGTSPIEAGTSTKYDLDEKFLLTFAVSGSSKNKCEGRGSLVKCSFGEKVFYSLTMRVTCELPSEFRNTSEFTGPEKNPGDQASGGTPAGGDSAERQKNELHRITDLESLITIIYGLLLSKKNLVVPRKGLIVVSGRTGAAKSKIVRGLIKRFVEDFEQDHHILTLEDPIEDSLFYSSEEYKSNWLYEFRPQANVCVTPREQGNSFGTLSSALSSALRQKTSLVYIGEVRSDNDWKEIMRFAGTGHLVITTTHAGSVVETLSKILTAMESRGDEDVKNFASRIIGIVHNEFGDLENEGQRYSFARPTLWRCTTPGLSSLITDGLSSILPNHPPNCEKQALETIEAVHSSFGSRWFFRKYTNNLTSPDGIAQGILKECELSCLEYDLFGA